MSTHDKSVGGPSRQWRGAFNMQGSADVARYQRIAKQVALPEISRQGTAYYQTRIGITSNYPTIRPCNLALYTSQWARHTVQLGTVCSPTRRSIPSNIPLSQGFRGRWRTNPKDIGEEAVSEDWIRLRNVLEVTLASSNQEPNTMGNFSLAP